jgi:hypothetical protein
MEVEEEEQGNLKAMVINWEQFIHTVRGRDKPQGLLSHQSLSYWGMAIAGKMCSMEFCPIGSLYHVNRPRQASRMLLVSYTHHVT